MSPGRSSIDQTVAVASPAGSGWPISDTPSPSSQTAMTAAAAATTAQAAASTRVLLLVPITFVLPTLKDPVRWAQLNSVQLPRRATQKTTAARALHSSKSLPTLASTRCYWSQARLIHAPVARIDSEDSR